MREIYKKIPSASVESLRELLKNLQVPEDCLDILKDEQIDGESFLELKFEYIRTMGIKVGHITRCLQIINKTKELSKGQKNTFPGKVEIVDLTLDNNELEDEYSTKPPPEKRLKMDTPSTSSVFDTSSQYSTDSTNTQNYLKVEIDESSRDVVFSEIDSMSRDSNQNVTSNNEDITNLLEPIFSRYGSVEKTLLNHAQGNEVLEAAKHGPITERCRKALIRIVVPELILAYNNNYYPPDSAKSALAEAIVTEFPLLKDISNSNFIKGWELYFDPDKKYGCIEYHLRKMREALPASEKKYKSKKTETLTSNLFEQSEGLLTEEELNEKKQWMLCQQPTEDSKNSIEICLEETHQNRQKWIKTKRPSIRQIYEVYPRLWDYNEDMIQHEFMLLYPDKIDNFKLKFSSFYVPRILAYCKNCRFDLWWKRDKIDDNILKALFLLDDLLPLTRKKISLLTKSNEKKSKINAEEIEDTMVNPINIEKLIIFDSKKQAESTNNIPYIVKVKTAQDFYYCIQLDGFVIMANDNKNIISTLDLLFKIYFIFNLDYPLGLQNLFNFIEYYIYKFLEPPTSVKVRSVHVCIHNYTFSES